MRQKTNFYQIGVFSLLGIFLFIVMFLAIVGHSWFDRPVYIETYFNESVQGLEIGSAVKYRGVLIGRVADIDFVNDIYNTESSKHGKQFFNHYIYVLMAINMRVFNKENQSHLQNIFNQAITDGMRVHLSPQGLTGASYLEMDFYDPATHPALAIDWTPDHPYVPTVLSEFSQITTNLNKFVQTLSNANIPQIMQNINVMTQQTSAAMTTVNTILSNQQQNIEASISNIRNITDTAKNYPSSLIFGAKPPKLDLKHDENQN